MQPLHFFFSFRRKGSPTLHLPHACLFLLAAKSNSHTWCHPTHQLLTGFYRKQSQGCAVDFKAAPPASLPTLCYRSPPEPTLIVYRSLSIGGQQFMPLTLISKFHTHLHPFALSFSRLQLLSMRLFKIFICSIPVFSFNF